MLDILNSQPCLLPICDTILCAYWQVIGRPNQGEIFGNDRCPAYGGRKRCIKVCEVGGDSWHSDATKISRGFQNIVLFGSSKWHDGPGLSLQIPQLPPEKNCCNWWLKQRLICPSAFGAAAWRISTLPVWVRWLCWCCPKPLAELPRSLVACGPSWRRCGGSTVCPPASTACCRC